MARLGSPTAQRSPRLPAHPALARPCVAIERGTAPVPARGRARARDAAPVDQPRRRPGHVERDAHPLGAARKGHLGASRGGSGACGRKVRVRQEQCGAEHPGSVRDPDAGADRDEVPADPEKRPRPDDPPRGKAERENLDRSRARRARQGGRGPASTACPRARPPAGSGRSPGSTTWPGRACRCGRPRSRQGTASSATTPGTRWSPAVRPAGRSPSLLPSPTTPGEPVNEGSFRALRVLIQEGTS